MGQNGSENVGDHKLVSDLGKNRSENSPTRLKTGRRFSVSDLSPTVNAQPATHQIDPTCITYRYHPTCHQRMMRETKGRRDDRQVANPPQLMEAQGLEQPAPPPAAQAMTDEK